MHLLLLGAGECGKSTVVKQMAIIHGKGYEHLPAEQTRQFKLDALRNVTVNLGVSVIDVLFSLSLGTFS